MTSHGTNLWLAVIATAAVTFGLIEGYHILQHQEVEKAPPKKKSTKYPQELIREQLSRNYSFLTEDGMDKVRQQNVIVVGAGGVGSWVVTMLARSGVSKIRVIDFDQVTLSSLNRNAVATLADVGVSKVDCIKNRIYEIAPWVEIDARNQLWNAEGGHELIFGDDFKPTYVIDAIDNLDTKVDLLAFCHKHNIPVILSGGALCKSDPTRINIADISKTDEDPLAKKVRVKLKKEYGILSGVTCVFSSEKADPRKAQLLPLPEHEFAAGKVEQLSALKNFRVRILPVLGTLPAMFGLVIATHVITTVSGYPVEQIEMKNRIHVYNDMIQSLAGQLSRIGRPDHRVPLSKADVSYILEELFRGKSPVSGIPTRLTLSIWDPSKPVDSRNIVCLTKEEQKAHEVRVLIGGEAVEDVYSEDVLNLVKKRFREDLYYSEFR